MEQTFCTAETGRGMAGPACCRDRHPLPNRINDAVAFALTGRSMAKQTPYFKGRTAMIGWAATFLIIAIIAGVLGFSGIAGTAVNIAWVLFVVGLILAVVFALIGRRPPV